MMQLTYVTELSAIVGQKLPYLKALLATSPDRVILRAKHLSEADYQSLALELLPTSQALPVYGIGGIKMTNVHKLPKEMAGVYIMRDSMVQPDPHAFTKAWRDTLVTLT